MDCTAVFRAVLLCVKWCNCVDLGLDTVGIGGSDHSHRRNITFFIVCKEDIEYDSVVVR